MARTLARDLHFHYDSAIMFFALTFGSGTSSIWQLRMSTLVNIPNVGDITHESGFRLLESTSTEDFTVGQNGVHAIAATGDGKVEFICFDDRSLALVNSGMGYPAYYPVHPVELKKPVKAVLMDLDGTTVRSEEFWIWIIEKTTASLLDNPGFQLEEADMPFVSGHSVSEHSRGVTEPI